MSSYKWRFFRVGGFEQVSIETGTDMLALQHLDQKLWAALSCPIKNLEFDYKTLQFVDSDRDGHIRVPEIIEAVAWACLLYTSDAADDLLCVDLGGRRIIKKKKQH